MAITIPLKIREIPLKIREKKQDDFVVELRARLKGCQFASLTYKTKQYFDKHGFLTHGGELSRYSIILGSNYLNLLEKSLLELEIQFNEGRFISDFQVFAAEQVRESLNKSLAAHRIGRQNEDYTKKGMYRRIISGLNLNRNDLTFQLFGMKQSQVIIAPGKHKKTSSSPITLAKQNIINTLPIARFREFALDWDTVESAKIAGETIILIAAG